MKLEVLDLYILFFITQTIEEPSDVSKLIAIIRDCAVKAYEEDKISLSRKKHFMLSSNQIFFLFSYHKIDAMRLKKNSFISIIF